MGHIFRAANGVIVWLGEETSGTTAAMELPRKVRRYWPSLLEDPTQLTRPEKTPAECPRWGQGAWPAFIMLLTRSWFRRLWVIQEVVCAKEIIVACGTSTCAWDDMVALVRTIGTLHVSQSATQNLGSRTAAQYISFMQELRGITEQGTKQAVKDYASEESMVPYVLTMAKDCEATDHRDKLFAFHHIARLWNRPDYAMPINELYLLFAAQYLQRIAYAITEFSCDETTLARRQWDFVYSAGLCNQRLDLPSWVPDWSQPWKARPLWLGTTCYTAGGSDTKEIAPLADATADGRPRLRLPLSIKLFDRVLAVGTESFRIMESGSHALSEALRNWLFSSMSLLHRNRAKPGPYADQHVAMACTITAEQVNGTKLRPEEAVKKYDLLLELLRLSDSEQSPEPLQDSLENERMYHSIISFLRGRVFFITERGYFGLAQVGVAWGDSIAIGHGAPLPVLIRPTLGIGHKTREYRMLCETFVHGIMEGEAWQDGGISSENIVLV